MIGLTLLEAIKILDRLPRIEKTHTNEVFIPVYNFQNALDYRSDANKHLNGSDQICQLKFIRRNEWCLVFNDKKLENNIFLTASELREYYSKLPDFNSDFVYYEFPILQKKFSFEPPDISDFDSIPIFLKLLFVKDFKAKTWILTIDNFAYQNTDKSGATYTLNEVLDSQKVIYAEVLADAIKKQEFEWAKMMKDSIDRIESLKKRLDE